MHLISKNTALLILGILSLACSRAVFFFIDDPEGPNLLIVVMLALGIYFLSLRAYSLFRYFKKFF